MKRYCRSRWAAAMCAGVGTVVSWTLAAPVALAGPTQEDVFKSIHESVGDSPTEWSRVLPFALAAAGLALLLGLFTHWRSREVTPRTLNHSGKLIKEVMKQIPLRPAELKQLKMLAVHASADQPLASPLTMLLCPSLMAKAIEQCQRQPGKFSRKTILHLARKVGLQPRTR